jgi:hypothetical protein
MKTRRTCTATAAFRTPEELTLGKVAFLIVFTLLEIFSILIGASAQETNLDKQIVEASRNPVQTQRETLRGLKGVRVLVVPLPPEVEADGLTATQVQTDTELRLRQAGIKVFGAEFYQVLPMREQAQLFVYINPVKSRELPLYALSIKVSVGQSIRLARNNFVSYAETWLEETVVFVGASKLSQMRSAANDLVGQFINAYLAVNPR